MCGPGLEIATPPLSTTLNPGQLGTQDIGLFINQHVGYPQPVSTAGGQNLQIVKREPEDLSHHRRLDSSSPDLDNSSGGIIISGRQRPKVNISYHHFIFRIHLIIIHHQHGSVPSVTCF